MLLITLVASHALLTKDLGKTTFKPKVTDLFSKSPAVNYLSAARFFLFGSRDIWFVVALPVFLQVNLNWTPLDVGTFLAAWIIGYGVIQAIAPYLTGVRTNTPTNGKSAFQWSALLCGIPALIAIALAREIDAHTVIILGLTLFGIVFAINSSLHSYLIVSYAREEGVSLDVGFYYMANAAGRLVGTLLSGWLYQQYGFVVCLWVSAGFIMAATCVSSYLPNRVVARQNN